MATHLNSKTKQSTTAPCVYITRPEKDCGALAGRLAHAEIAYCITPLLEISALSSPADQQLAKNCVLDIDQQDILIFVSQNAVERAFRWFEDYWPQFPSHPQFCGIGEKTTASISAHALSVYGHDVSFIQTHTPKYTKESMTSETLLENPALIHVQNKKITLFRGVGGRTTLYDVLTERGAKVQHCSLYERKIPESAETYFTHTHPKSEHDVVLLFSGETLQNFHHVIRPLGEENWQRIKIVVPSQRVAILANKLGFECVTAAVNASENAMWHALEQSMEKTARA